MPMDLKNNPLTSFIRTSQSVSKERKSILHTVRGKCYFHVSLKALYYPPALCTPYTCSSNIEEVLENLQGVLQQLFQWFSANHLVGNAGKRHLLTSSKIANNIAISNTNVSSEQKVKLLGINLESRLNFDYHVNTLLNKANKKYHALARVCN